MISTDQVHNVKILIVDDQKLQALFLEKVFKSEGYKNVSCEINPVQAVATCRTYQPDIILLNLIMSRLDGFPIMKALNAERSENFLPIIALSEDKNPEIRTKALESGASDFIIKPFESIEVLQRVYNLIVTRLLHIQVRDHNKILEERVRERTKELHDTRLDIIRRLAHAAECRDDDTGTHIIRMSRYCERLSQEMGLSAGDCELVLNASPLHDIGKIGIPDSILLKPGKLTAEEFDFMKTHTTIGAKLLSGSSSKMMQMAEMIALTHQEKWDGSGYPQGLKGEEIPLIGHICCICDVFDALTSVRPYKKA